MSRGLQWKLVAGFILVFLAGGMTGAYFAAFHARRTFFEVHHPGMMASRMKERLRAQLNLTPEQMGRIAPIIDKTSADLEKIRMDTGGLVHQTFLEAHRQMTPILTEEQRVRLKQMEKHHHRVRGMRSHHSSPAGGAEFE